MRYLWPQMGIVMERIMNVTIYIVTSKSVISNLNSAVLFVCNASWIRKRLNPHKVIIRYYPAGLANTDADRVLVWSEFHHYKALTYRIPIQTIGVQIDKIFTHCFKSMLATVLFPNLTSCHLLVGIENWGTNAEYSLMWNLKDPGINVASPNRKTTSQLFAQSQIHRSPAIENFTNIKRLCFSTHWL